jgi:hypothetical protein
MPVILATQEAEIRRISVPSWLQGNSSDPISKKTVTKRGGGVGQGVGPESKLQYHKKEKLKIVLLQMTK